MLNHDVGRRVIGEAMSETSNIISFQARAERLAEVREQERKDQQLKLMQDRFAKSLPGDSPKTKKKGSVSDHMARKRAKKKR